MAELIVASPMRCSNAREPESRVSVVQKILTAENLTKVTRALAQAGAATKSRHTGHRLTSLLTVR